MKIEFSNHEYMMTWGKAPKGGYGFWGFKCDGKEYWASGTLSEAKKAVKGQIKEAHTEKRVDSLTAYIMP